MKIRETKIIIQPLYKYLGDKTELPQFYIVCNEYFCTIRLSTKNIGQDGGETPFQDLDSVQAYFAIIMNKKDTTYLDKLTDLLKNEQDL